jgi:hypothetical protein
MSERLKDNIAKGLDEQSKMVRHLPKPTSEPTALKTTIAN